MSFSDRYEALAKAVAEYEKATKELMEIHERRENLRAEVLELHSSVLPDDFHSSPIAVGTDTLKSTIRSIYETHPALWIEPKIVKEKLRAVYNGAVYSSNVSIALKSLVSDGTLIHNGKTRRGSAYRLK
jgi:hypothetical protein